MPLQVACPGCDKNFRVSEQHAGKKVRCPNCQTAFEVPADESPRTGPENAAAPSTPSPQAAAPSSPGPQITVESSPGSHAGGPANFAPNQGAPQYTRAAGAAGGQLTDQQKTFGIISVVLGALGLVVNILCCCPFGGYVAMAAGIVCGIAALVLAFQSDGPLKIVGMILGILSLAFQAIFILLMILGIGAMAFMQNLPRGP